MTDIQSSPFSLPGFTLPLTYQRQRSYTNDEIVYANALDQSDIEDGFVGHLFLVRELAMMRIMETITDKPHWEDKVFNEEITAKWRQEIVDGENVTERMMDYIIAELRWKSEDFKKTGIVTSYDPGVVKSDSAIPPDIQQRLQDLAKSLEEDGPKDYHPKSDNKVVDLVHPALFPLVYGRTRVLRDKLIGTDDCFLSVGLGELTSVQKLPGQSYGEDHQTYSNQYQWLPCSIKFDSNGQCQIASYINNLHPTKYRDLYGVIEKVLTRCIPLWNATLTRHHYGPRIKYTEVEYLPSEEPEPFVAEDESEPEDFIDRLEAWREAQVVKHPDAPEFEPRSQERSDVVDLQKFFAEKGLQVIVKLANIELMPEKPNYDGGSWHIEGQLNERICATAIYYYDCENITDNTLAFRHRADDQYFDGLSYEQGQFQFLRVFGFEEDAGYDGGEQFTQDLGGVTCREGRLLTFPNTLQHCVSPFKLADPSKPGHRKILAFFLIDPTRRIISTANVPPQREDWCKDWKDTMNKTLGQRLPVELQHMIMSDVDFKPMTMDEAKEHRIKLMEERGAKSTATNRDFEQGGFNLCEH